MEPATFRLVTECLYLRIHSLLLPDVRESWKVALYLDTVIQKKALSMNIILIVGLIVFGYRVD
jgi:hypothetical protein